MTTYTIATSDDMKICAARIAKELSAPTIFALSGELGAGKTTFSQGFLGAFGITSVKSPTYGIYNTYKISKEGIERVHHFDLYRIKDIEELYEIGFEEIIHDEKAHILIEWPEIAEGLFPEDTRKITILYQEKVGRVVKTS